MCPQPLQGGVLHHSFGFYVGIQILQKRRPFETCYSLHHAYTSCTVNFEEHTFAKDSWNMSVITKGSKGSQVWVFLGPQRPPKHKDPTNQPWLLVSPLYCSLEPECEILTCMWSFGPLFLGVV